jgi:hypothetical protein
MNAFSEKPFYGINIVGCVPHNKNNKGRRSRLVAMFTAETVCLVVSYSLENVYSQCVLIFK